MSYTGFARRTQQVKKKKIPTPSETRWLFYRESLKALLDKKETVDVFINLRGVREKWSSYISTPKHHLGEVKDVFFSFTHPLVDAHFQFAFFVLDILGNINTIFQMKYGFILNFWEYLVFSMSFLSAN